MTSTPQECGLAVTVWAWTPQGHAKPIYDGACRRNVGHAGECSVIDPQALAQFARQWDELIGDGPWSSPIIDRDSEPRQ